MSYSLEDLLYLMERLRKPDTGCPWDIEQSYSTIVPSTIEEAYEVADTIAREDYDHLKEELGDLLFQVIFYSQLGKEDGRFTFTDIVDGLTNKLVLRHPHVFPKGDLHAERKPDEPITEDLSAQWEALKLGERARKGQRGVLDDVPLALPAVQRAQKLQKRAATVGFDFSSVVAALEKVSEELAEVRGELEAGDDAGLTEELGDLLFAVVNAVRLAGCDAETLLSNTNRKFCSRFNCMSELLAQQGVSLQDATIEQMELEWQAAKSIC